jgi:Clp amino terminal domain, pathogenicity island component
VFERFTEEARNVLVLAQEEARILRHRHIGTEHLLLGTIREGGLAARALHSLGVRLDTGREQVAAVVGRGDKATSGQIAFTPRARSVLERAMREAHAREDDGIRPEHLLLGIVADREGVAAQVLGALDVTEDAVRAAAARIAEEAAPKPPRAEAVAESAIRRVEDLHHGRPSLDYDTSVQVLSEWSGRDVTVVLWSPTFNFTDPPYRGVLELQKGGTDADRATFSVRTGAPNPTGITFVVDRESFVEGNWVGGTHPGGGLSVLQGERRTSVYLADGAPSPTTRLP